MRRFLAVLRRFWNVAGALVGVGSLPPITKILGLIWRRIADIDTAADLWVKAGGSIPRLLGYIESPYFGPALIVIGFLWALLRWRAEELLGSERAITVTDRIGWTFVAGALIAILSTMLFNEFLVEAKAPQFAPIDSRSTI